jgi:hypothetical protein
MASFIRYVHLPEDLKRARELQAAAEAAAREAIEKRADAEADVFRQLDESAALLERLLVEQRTILSQESTKLKAQLEVEAKWRYTTSAELSRLREALEVGQKAHELEASKLRDEIKRLTPPPKKRVPKKLGSIDLDEGPDAPPIAQQLASALRANSARVLDLFRSWDADGDGQVSRAEFHRAMPALGLDVPKETIDELFSEWDKDGGRARLRRAAKDPLDVGTKPEP